MTFKNILKTTSDVLGVLKDISECTAPKIETSSEEPVILTAARIRELRWYTVPQLAAIYDYGKVKVRIQDSDAAYRELRWLNAQQLAAIFGTGGDTDGD